MTHHYPDLGCSSDWSCHERNLLQPIRRTTQIWVVTRHQYGISALASLTSSFRGETGSGVTKCRLFTQATCTWREDYVISSPSFSRAVLKRGKCSNASENGTFSTDRQSEEEPIEVLWYESDSYTMRANAWLQVPFIQRKLVQDREITRQIELPWVSQHFLTKLGEPFAWETKRLAQLLGSPTQPSQLFSI